MTELENMIKETADETLQQVYRRRMDEDVGEITKLSWVSDTVRYEIKEKKTKQAKKK